MIDLDKLPPDLVSFLESGKAFQYDPALCEAGAVTLRALEQLRFQLFPMETGSLDNEDDPSWPEFNSFLIDAVDLVSECSGDYEPTGLLLWLPAEARYGVWDSSHCVVSAFDNSVTWEQISAAPHRFINAQWTGMFEDSAIAEPLPTPWEEYEYSDGQYHEPLDPQ